MKVCKICNIEKEINQFPKNKKMKDGLLNSCKTCLNKRRKISYKKNIDKRKEYLSKNKEKIKERFKKYHKSYYNDNREKILDYQKIYRLKNIDMKKEYEKKYRSENKDKRSKYHKERIKNDILYRIGILIRRSIGDLFKRKSIEKVNTTQQILGCSFEEFKLHLESKFETWMNWKNKGLYNGEFNYGWDIDHIIPLSSAINEEEILKLCNYKNLQPLCSKINRDIKKDKII